MRMLEGRAAVLPLLIALLLLGGCAAPGPRIRLTLRPTGGPLVQAAFDRLRLVEENRASQAGLSIESVDRTPDGNVVLEFVCPTGYESQRAAALLSATGRLEFVDWESVPAGVGAEWDAYLSASGKGAAPPRPKPLEEGTYESVLGGGFVTHAESTADQSGRMAIGFTMNAASAKTWGEYTTAHVGKQVGIVLDGIVLSAPVVRTPILDGVSEISGSFTAAEAEDLAAILQSSELPSPMTVESRVEVRGAQP
jgi:preprotein translocase subunit SecD